jgi:hypothetical protein
MYWQKWTTLMKMRKIILLISAAIVLLSRDARAEDCTLSGVTVSRDGAVVPGVAVNVTSMWSFRMPSYQRVTSDSEGKFTLANLPCGKYMVSAMQRYDTYERFDREFPPYVMVDIKKQPAVRLVLPKVDKLAAMLKSADTTAAGTGGGLAEPPAISLLRRQYFERINASKLAEFDGGSLAEKKRMYSLAFSSHLANIAGPEDSGAAARAKTKMPSQTSRWKGMIGVRGKADQATPNPWISSQQREEDAQAKRQMANAAAIVRQTLPAEDVSIFGRGPEMEQARLFLRALLRLPRHDSQCSMYSLWVVDSTDANAGAVSVRAYMPFLDGAALANWAEMDSGAKCKLIDGGVPNVLELVQGLEKDGSIENVKAVGQRFAAHGTAPKRTVIEMFGNEGGTRYDQAKSTDTQLEIYRASLIMQLCWFVAYAAL